MKFVSIIFLVVFCPFYLTGQTSAGSYRNRVLQNTYQVHEVGLLYTIESSSRSVPNSLKFNSTGKYYSFSFHQVMPKKIVLNDSLEVSLIGYNIGFMSGRDLMYPIRDMLNVNDKGHFQFLISIGFDLGRLRMYNNPLLRKKNGYFAPKIEIRPIFYTGKGRNNITFGASFDYRYDVSNSNWKNTLFSKNKSYSLDKLRQSDFSWQIFLGWSIN